ncbi:MAG: hypothetical protein A2107_08685 [Verrucomicrobia bacterium GWF2_62_7]|nr:MAG: hypothetical protein A2107_08685 [Verrucomicrobia bacterium GWF2_62_7]
MNTQSESYEWTVNRRFNSVIVHEDLPTEQRARRLWDHLLNDMGQGVQCGVTYHSAQQIKESLDFEQSGLTDIVIVSVHDLARFFFSAAAWLNDWLSIHSASPRALFILHDREADERMVEFLRTITESAGVTLFGHSSEAGDDLAVSDPEDDRQPAEDLALVS